MGYLSTLPISDGATALGLGYCKDASARLYYDDGAAVQGLDFLNWHILADIAGDLRNNRLKQFLPTYWNALQLQQAGFSPCRIAIIGDSLSVGQFAQANTSGQPWYQGAPYQSSLSALLAGLLAGTDSTFFGGVQKSDTGAAGLSHMLSYDTRISQGAGIGWQTYYIGYPTIGANFDAIGATATLTFSPVEAWDKVDIYSIKESGYGSLTLSGAVSGTINSGGFSASGVNVDSFSKSYGTGAITLTPTNENHIVGLDFYSTTSPKLNVLKLGLGSSTSADWTATGSNWHSLDCLNFIKTSNPVHLYVLQVGANDMINNGSGGLSAYISNMQALITALQMSSTNPTGGDVLLVFPPLVNGASNSVVQLYKNALWQLARSNGCLFVDAMAAFLNNSYASGKNWLSVANNVHCSAAGYAALAGYIYASGAP